MDNIIQWNCRGTKANLEEIELIISTFDPIAICLQETYVKPNDNFSIKGYTHSHYYKEGVSRAHGGTSIYVRDNVPSSNLNVVSNLQITTRRITLHKTITLCNIYIPPNEAITPEDLNNIINHLPKPFILLGDFNAHNPIWGSSKINPRGRVIENIIHSSSLVLLNNNSTTYLHPGTGSTSCIDLTLCDPSLAANILNWRTHNSCCGSDHFPIIITLANDTPINFPPNWNIKKANWSQFTKLCSEQIPDNTVDVNSIHHFTSTLIKIAEETIPINHHPQNNYTPWFDNACKEAIYQRKKALQNFKNHPTSQNLEIFRLMRAKARRTIKQAKTDSWNNYISSITSQTPPSKVWNMIRNFKGLTTSNAINHLIENGKTITNTKDIANTFAKNFCKISSDENLNPVFCNYKTKEERSVMDFSSNNNETYNLPFTNDELDEAIRKSKITSQGPDRIHYAFLKHLPTTSLNYLLKIFNYLWFNNYFPDTWRHANVIPIPKPNKNKDDATNYRPIALTSCLCKTMERLVNNRLYWFLEKHNILNNSQNGFRKHRNCLDHVCSLDTFIRESFIKDFHTIAIFFDLQKAYDTTWKFGIVKDLHQAGIKGHMAFFIKNFLSHRTFKVRVGNTYSDTFIQKNGVPQGSILSPLLFTLKLNNITKDIPHHIKKALFVDDFTIYASDPDLQNLETKLQSAINTISRWLKQNGFTISKNKTVLIHFKNKDYHLLKPKLQINGNYIPVVDKHKFLGITFDEKLTYTHHIMDLKSRCTKSINLLKVLSSTNWGANRKTLLMIYRALIRSKIDYGNYIYQVARNYYLKQLYVIENEALRLCLGAYKTTPINSLHVEANEPNFQHRSLSNGMSNACRILANPLNPCYYSIRIPSLTRLFTLHNHTIKPTLGIRLIPHFKKANLNPSIISKNIIPDIPPWTITKPTIYLTLASFKKSHHEPNFFIEKMNRFISHYKDYTCIYTDGSKRDERSAAAAVCPGITFTNRLPEGSSIFSAETRAIQLALNFIDLTFHDKFIILTDSLSVLQSMKNKDWSNPLISQTLIQLNSLINRNKRIIFFWIPSHIGIKGNDRADKAANLALTNHITSMNIPLSDFKPTIRDYANNCWQETWNNEENNKLQSIKPSVKDLTPMHSHYRKEDVAITRLRLGHTYLTHSYLLNNDPPPICQHCNKNLSVSHILLVCPLYNDHRKNLSPANTMNHFFQKNSDMDILNFLYDCNLFNEI